MVARQTKERLFFLIWYDPASICSIQRVRMRLLATKEQNVIVLAWDLFNLADKVSKMTPVVKTIYERSLNWAALRRIEEQIFCILRQTSSDICSLRCSCRVLLSWSEHLKPIICEETSDLPSRPVPSLPRRLRCAPSGMTSPWGWRWRCWTPTQSCPVKSTGSPRSSS